jgi:hypothetical protein
MTKVEKRKKATSKMRKWRKKNKQRNLENGRRWRKDNVEKARAKNRKHYWNNREDMLARNKAYYPEYYAKNDIKSKRRLRQHGVTQEWLDAKMLEQDGKCALCKQPFTETPHIDHNHICCQSRRNCGTCQRGLLCKDCNLGLGRFKDNTQTLENAIQYLRRYNNELVSQPPIQTAGSTLERNAQPEGHSAIN